MIPGYSDHAANERTFLAWVRTGIAVIAFGFVIEKFNLFVLTIASSTSSEATQRLLERLQGPFGRYDGHALRRTGAHRRGNRALCPHREIARRSPGTFRRQRAHRADPVGGVGAPHCRFQRLCGARLTPGSLIVAFGAMRSSLTKMSSQRSDRPRVASATASSAVANGWA